ncbi:MAG: TIGR01906 family membrane protein [Dehalococcoidia bacterium]
MVGGRVSATRTPGWAIPLAGRLASVLFFVAVPVALILGAVRFAFSWQPVYTYAVKSYHADEAAGFPQNELLRATHSIRTYFTDSRRDLNITINDASRQPQTLFNQQEIAHMRDVKALVHRVYLLLDLAVIYLIIYAVLWLTVWRGSLWSLARSALTASAITIALIVVAGVSSAIDFNQLFTEFHILSFSNDFWQLDPSRDHLVQIFPQGFWYDITLFVGAMAMGGAVLLAAISAAYLWFDRRSVPAARAGAAAGAAAPAAK